MFNTNKVLLPEQYFFLCMKCSMQNTHFQNLYAVLSQVQMSFGYLCSFTVIAKECSFIWWAESASTDQHIGTN